MSNLKTELLRFKDIVDGLIEKAEDTNLDLDNYIDIKKINKLSRLINQSDVGINAILELAEELEKDND